MDTLNFFFDRPDIIGFLRYLEKKFFAGVPKENANFLQIFCKGPQGKCFTGETPNFELMANLGKNFKF
jgi:hypothetical protein